MSRLISRYRLVLIHQVERHRTTPPEKRARVSENLLVSIHQFEPHRTTPQEKSRQIERPPCPRFTQNRIRCYTVVVGHPDRSPDPPGSGLYGPVLILRSAFRYTVRWVPAGLPGLAVPVSGQYGVDSEYHRIRCTIRPAHFLAFQAFFWYRNLFGTTCFGTKTFGTKTGHRGCRAAS